MVSAQQMLLHMAGRLCTALRFLTLIPISWRTGEDHKEFEACLLYFPLVGIFIGGTGFLGIYLLTHVFPLPVVSAMSLVYLAFISGCLHLDGLSDSADGLLSSRPREDCLRIMKDSRAGAMGIVVVLLVLLTKYAALSTMDGYTLCVAVFVIPLAGRSAILVNMATLRYARGEGGLGSLFYSGNSKLAAVVAVVLLVTILTILQPQHLFSVVCGFLLVLLFFCRWCKVKLGGATGDTLGAVCELTEMITAVSLTVSTHQL